MKSLAHIAVKRYLYFASNDSNAIRLIIKSKEWSTGLDNVNSIEMFELIYFFFKKGYSSSKNLKMLYKYEYYLTQREKSVNPNWNDFVSMMDTLYNDLFITVNN